MCYESLPNFSNILWAHLKGATYTQIIIQSTHLQWVRSANKPNFKIPPSMTWIVAMFAVGLVAAIVGGLVCASIAPGKLDMKEILANLDDCF